MSGREGEGSHACLYNKSISLRVRNKFKEVKFNPSQLHPFSQSVSVSFHLFVSFSISFISVLQFSDAFYLLLKKNYFIYVWLCWVLGCCKGFLQLWRAGAALVPLCELLTALTSLVVERGLWCARASVGVAPGFEKVKDKVTQSCLTLRPHGLYSPANFPRQNPGVGSCSLLPGIFPSQGLNPHLLCPLHWQTDSLPLHHQQLCPKMSH